MNKDHVNRRHNRLLGWAAVLGALLLFPPDLMAQKEKTTGSSSSRSSSGSSASPAPSRSVSPSRSSGSRSSGSSTRSAPSRSSSVSRSKSAPSPSKAQSSANRALKSQVKASPKSPARTPVDSDNPSRGYDSGGAYEGQYDPNYRGRSDSRHRYGHGGYYGGYYGYPYYGRYGYYGYRYPYYFYGPYGYFFYPYGGVYSGGRSARYGNVLGALDLNVRPKKAEVFLDGNPIGAVDRYDGFPSYLWLEPGTYTVAFYLEGHQTVTRRYTLYPGVVIDVKERLPPGVAERPEPPLMEAVPQPGGSTAEGAPPPTGDAGVGRLQLSILPGDTAVYLDGHFLGTGDELSQLSAGLIVEPGDHVLELVRPGYVTEEVPISVPAGDRIEVDLSLRPR